LEIEGFEILIVRSRARKRTIQARLINDRTIKVLAPFYADAGFLDDFIKKSVKKLSRKAKIFSGDDDLTERSKMLKDKFVPEAPDFIIGYSDSLRTTWGKCFVRDKNIILNNKLKECPVWVTDLVIIHEIAHLVHSDHGKEFRRIVSRYKLKERATGYLLAKGMKAESI